jgi:hypothetical protein
LQRQNHQALPEFPTMAGRRMKKRNMFSVRAHSLAHIGKILKRASKFVIPSSGSGNIHVLDGRLKAAMSRRYTFRRGSP